MILNGLAIIPSICLTDSTRSRWIPASVGFIIWSVAGGYPCVLAASVSHPKDICITFRRENVGYSTESENEEIMSPVEVGIAKLKKQKQKWLKL